MNIIKYCLILSLVLLVGTSCEKVIQVKLNSADKKLVIDAQLTDVPGTCMVTLSRTKEFSASNALEGVSGAEVEIVGTGGERFTLTEVENGVYRNDAAKGAPGNTYELRIKVDGKAYTAQSTMPQYITFDSLYAEKQGFFGDDMIFANVAFQDPEGQRNYYRFVQHINDYKIPGFFLMDDDLSDGKFIRSTLFYFLDDDKEPVKSGDVFTVEMQVIDEAVYKYWFSLQQSSTGNSSSAAPANPVSNIVGDALGYFSAHTKQVKTTVAP